MAYGPYSTIKLNHSSIQGLGRSEVVHNVLAMGVHHGSELVELVLRDLERSEEVDPLHHLVTGWGGQRSLVVSIWGDSATNASNASNKLVNPEVA